MERRKFVKRLSVFTTGSLVLSGSNLYATSVDKKTNNIDFLPLSSIDSKITLKGNFIDSKTFQPIKSVQMTAKIERNRFFPLKESIQSMDGSYKIQSGFSKKKRNEKVNIQIVAKGYKTYNSTIYLTANGSDIHSEEWNYNPDFKSDYCPKNENDNNQIHSTYNFHLVKI